MDKIPVTIITGFLGSGKTTLIKRICSEMTSKHVGVVQNEYSELMGIEKPILASSGATVYELPNGCLCCSVKSQLVSALESFLDFSDRIDWIIIEAAGTSDPVSLAGSLWLDDNLESKLKLNGVVTITDVETIKRFMRFIPPYNNSNCEDSKDISDFYNTFCKQLSVCDLIVVNKIDVNPLTDDLRSFLMGLNDCKLIESVRCNFDLNILFQLDTFGTNKLLSVDNVSHNEHTELPPRFRSVRLKTSCVYSLKFINDTIASLLWEHGNVYRCKGVFRAYGDCSAVGCVDGLVCSFELQGIGDVFEITKVEVPLSDNIFLFIGNDLDHKLLNNLFKQ